MYQLQKQLGALYRHELAYEVTKLGYAITKGKDSNFEIASLSPESLKTFSQRAQAIETQLAERGKSRAQASSAEKQTIALDTRQVKGTVPQAELVQAWREVAEASGLTEEKHRHLVSEAQRRLAAHAAQESSYAFGRDLLADQAVAQGAAMLGERNSVFATTALHEAVGRFGLGTVSQAEIAETITQAETAGELERRTYLDYRGARFEGMTTITNITNERTDSTRPCPFSHPLRRAKWLRPNSVQSSKGTLGMRDSALRPRRFDYQSNCWASRVCEDRLIRAGAGRCTRHLLAPGRPTAQP